MINTTPRKWTIQQAIYKKIPNPCNGCTKRKVGCHSGCPDEAEYKAKVDAEGKKANAVYCKEKTVYIGAVKSKAKARNGKGTCKRWNEYYRGNKNG